jgi:hypothetical protein
VEEMCNGTLTQGAPCVVLCLCFCSFGNRTQNFELQGVTVCLLL